MCVTLAAVVSVTEPDLCFTSVRELARGIRDGRFSSEEIVRAHLGRIEALNPRLNGLLAIAPESALEQAVAADRAVAANAPVGPLHGVPFTVKDVFRVALGTRFVPAPGISRGPGPAVGSESALVRRARAAGGILLGVSRATLWHDREEAYGPAHNPYCLEHTPGGSSGGECVSIAAGCSPLGFGSDSGGSLRQPAHYSGLATLRPSNGRVPRGTDADPTDPRTVAGPIARSILDVALALEIVSGPDPADPATLPLAPVDLYQVAVKGLRVAVHTHNSLVAATSETSACVMRAAAVLEAAGARVVLAAPPELDMAWKLSLDYWAHARGEGTLSEYLKFQERWERYRVALHVWMTEWDLIVCPVEAFPAPRAGANAPGVFTYTAPYSLLGWPSAVVRAGSSSEGLPIGVQMIAGPYRDDIALGSAATVEAALGGFEPPALLFRGR